MIHGIGETCLIGVICFTGGTCLIGNACLIGDVSDRWCLFDLCYMFDR